MSIQSREAEVTFDAVVLSYEVSRLLSYRLSLSLELWMEFEPAEVEGVIVDGESQTFMLAHYSSNHLSPEDVVVLRGTRSSSTGQVDEYLIFEQKNLTEGWVPRSIVYTLPYDDGDQNNGINRILAKYFFDMI